METTSKAMPMVGSDTAALAAAGTVAAGVAAGAWGDGRALVCARTIDAPAASNAAATINFHSLRFTRNARGPFVTWLNLFLDPDDCSPSPSQSFSTGTLRSETFASRNRQIQIAYLFNFLQRFHSWCEGICFCLPLEPPYVCHSPAPFVCHSAAQRRNLLLSLPSSPTAAPCGRSQSSPPVPCPSTALAQSLRSN